MEERTSKHTGPLPMLGVHQLEHLGQGGVATFVNSCVSSQFSGWGRVLQDHTLS